MTAVMLAPPLSIGLTAAIVALRGEEPMILVNQAGSEAASLPSGPFDPLAHRTFEIGLRASVAEQARAGLGYVEQLYTFGDRGRHARIGDLQPHVVSVGYLALTKIDATSPHMIAAFSDWYRFFPWEDWRGGRPRLIDQEILPALSAWMRDFGAKGEAERVQRLFGPDSGANDEENVLERYELLYEAGLVAEARRDGRENAIARAQTAQLGLPMQFDHRRILATAMGRLRAKLKYRPVIFEMMPDAFTLTALQRTVEAIVGRKLHKQNFRRLVFATNIVEITGQMLTTTGGRPAALYRFARQVARERPSSGLRVGRRG